MSKEFYDNPQDLKSSAEIQADDAIQEKFDKAKETKNYLGETIERETVSVGIEKVGIATFTGEPEFEKDMFVIREKVKGTGVDGKTWEKIKVFIGENAVEAKNRQAKDYAERDEYDYDQHVWSEEKNGKIIHHIYDLEDYKSTGQKLADKLGQLKAKIIGGKEENK